MNRIGRLTVLIALGILILGHAAVAGTVSGCNNCFGGEYSLWGTQQDAPGGALDTWRIVYTLDLTNATPPSTAPYISQVALKVSSQLDSWNVVSNPTGWTATTGSINSGPTVACDGSGGNGWICFQAGSAGNGLVAGKSYQFTVDVTTKPGQFNFADASIQANWDPAEGLLLSEKTTVPEGTPGELSLLLGGFGGLLMWRKRLLKR